MGEFINICAGADSISLPDPPIDALLLNVLGHCSSPSKIRTAIELYRMAKPKHFMLDSSGYQVLLAELNAKRLSFKPNLELKSTKDALNIAPKHVMESVLVFQPYMPDIVVGLDYPIRKHNDVESPESEFFTKLELNVSLTIQSATWWKELCPQVKFFIPIQCYDLDQFNIFLINRIRIY